MSEEPPPLKLARLEEEQRGRRMALKDYRAEIESIDPDTRDRRAARRRFELLATVASFLEDLDDLEDALPAVRYDVQAWKARERLRPGPGYTLAELRPADLQRLHDQGMAVAPHLPPCPQCSAAPGRFCTRSGRNHARRMLAHFKTEHEDGGGAA